MRRIPLDLEQETKHLKIGQFAFQRKGDIIVQVWTDERLVQVKSTIHDTTVVNAGRKHRTDLEIKQPFAIFAVH
jgi:hypothetical protein